MTCIVGLITSEDEVYMGADSAMTWSWQQRTIKGKKLFKMGRILAGMAGKPRLMNLLENLHVPEQKQSQDHVYYITHVITPLIYDRLSNANAIISATKEDGETSGGTLLLGYRGKLLLLESNFTVVELDYSYVAIGSGDDVAMGVLYALKENDIPPKLKILTALRAATEFGSGVRPPYYVESSYGYQEKFKT